MSSASAQDILIGPRTTVYALLQAYPFMDPYFCRRVSGFAGLEPGHPRTRWSRVMTLSDVSDRMAIPWRQLAREVAEEVEQGTGRPARVVDAPYRIVDDERRLAQLREIVDGLEAGGSLLEMAARWRAATADLEHEEADALDAALSAAATAGRLVGGDVARAAAEPGDEDLPLPPGHPLDTQRREARQVRVLCAGLREGLVRLGGSPTRRRWQSEKPLVSDRIEGLSGVELRFRREQQAWFPALRVHGIDGPQSLLSMRQAEALETLRRLRLAVARDDAASVADGGVRLVDALEDLLAQDERLLEPLAVRHFSPSDWAAVRELEDGVGWALVPAPPAWPGATNPSAAARQT